MISRRATTYDLDFSNSQEKFNWLYTHSCEHDDAVEAINALPSSLTVGTMGKQPLYAGEVWLIPKGWWYVVSAYMTAGVTILSYDSANDVWVALLPLGGLVMSDGKNIQIWNNSSSSTNVVLQRLT